MRTDARLTLRAGVRFLRRRGDSLFHPDTVDLRAEVPSVSNVRDRLASPSPTIRLAALWDVSESALITPEMLPIIEACLGDCDSQVQLTAIRTLGAFGATAAGSVQRLIAAVWQGRLDSRIAAIQTLGEIGAMPEEVVPVLGACLRENHSSAVATAAGALAHYGSAAAPVEPDMLNALEKAALVDDHDRMTGIIAALIAIGPDARSRVRAHMAGRDPEALRNALRAFREQ